MLSARYCPPQRGGARRKKVAQHNLKNVASQAVLAVARTCRECGLRLGASSLEASLHKCTASLEWPLGGEAVGKATKSTCRIVRLGAGQTTPAARQRFEMLWEFIREDLSHGLEAPSAAAITAGDCTVLLCLRSHEVIGLLWAEPAGKAELLDSDEALGDSPSSVFGSSSNNRTDLSTSSQIAVSIGVALIWVRRTERRRGHATSMLDAARRCMTALGGAADSVPLAEVAFSQPTSLGCAMARSYVQSVHHGKVPVYCPSWA